MARRKRRSKADAVSAGTVRAIKARKRAFLSEVSKLLSDALGFGVRVSMLPPKVDLSPDMRRAARRPAAENRRQIREASSAVAQFYAPLNDPLPSSLLGQDEEDAS